MQLPPLGMVMDQLPYQGKCSHTGKVFGVGVFKTGTSSLSAELRTLGYTSCAKTRGFWIVKATKGRYYYFDGPTLRQAIQADPETRYALRAMANLTLSATDGPWLFYHEVKEANGSPSVHSSSTACGRSPVRWDC